MLVIIMLLQKGAIESAIEDYQMMVEIDPNDSCAILKMGMHHFNKKYTAHNDSTIQYRQLIVVWSSLHVRMYVQFIYW